jgi:hypothetical protein
VLQQRSGVGMSRQKRSQQAGCLGLKGRLKFRDVQHELWLKLVDTEEESLTDAEAVGALGFNLLASQLE